MANTIWKEVFLIMCSSSRENARNTERFSLSLRITDDYALTILCCSPHKIVNDEGKLLGLPMNRALTDESGVPYDIVCGTFFVVGIGDENFTSLTEQQIEKYRKKYANEMVFSVPVPSGNHKKQCNKDKNEHER